MNKTPETDAEQHEGLLRGNPMPTQVVHVNFARKLERERDEAREALADWENAAAHVEADHPDEKHCGCVSVLRKLLADARSERDDAREQVKNLIYISDRAIALADIDFENDKFGVVSELRGDLEKIKESK